jgi:hypothetical protein
MSRDLIRVAGFVVSGILLLATAVGFIVTGTRASLGGLGLAAMAALAFGVLLRTGQSGVARPIGSVLIALSVVGLLGLVVLLWLAFNGMGRPM